MILRGKKTTILTISRQQYRFSHDLIDIFDMDDIVLSQTAAKLKKEYMKDILFCLAGDSLAFDMALFDERYLAHDTFETNFDILQDVNFELGLFFEDNLQHWVNADNQP